MRPIGARTAPRALLPNPLQPGTLLVPLTKGRFAIIDEADGPAVAQFRWTASERSDRPGVYARTETTSLHRFLWRLWGRPDVPEIDHENTNGLDCRRDNLRDATRSDNAHNISKYANNTSGSKGVTWDKRTSKWSVRITASNVVHWLGRFSRIEDAEIAYATAARRLHGEFART